MTREQFRPYPEETWSDEYSDPDDSSRDIHYEIPVEENHPVDRLPVGPITQEILEEIQIPSPFDHPFTPDKNPFIEPFTYETYERLERENPALKRPPEVQKPPELVREIPVGVVIKIHEDYSDIVQ